jgi:hypothetical protein
MAPVSPSPKGWRLAWRRRIISVMAHENVLSEEQVAERLDKASEKLDEHVAREIADEFQREGLAVVQREPGSATVDVERLDKLVEALINDPNVATKGESMLFLPKLRLGRRSRNLGKHQAPSA